MKSKYQCPYCQYISLRKWNVQNHVRNVHRIKVFSNESNEKTNINQQNIRPKEYVQLNFPNGNNEKPNTNHQKIRPIEFHTETDCPDHKSREILQKIGAEIALLLLKEYKVIQKPVVITSKGVSILE